MSNNNRTVKTRVSGGVSLSKQMLKQCSVLSFLILFTFTAACGTGHGNSPYTHGEGGSQKLKTEPLDFTIEQEQALPETVKTTVEQVTSTRSKSNEVVTTEGRTYVIIALGERSTGGYSVDVQKIEQRGDALHVYAKEAPPPKGAMVIQVISYPFTVVSVKGTYDDNDVQFHVEYAQ